MSTVAAAPTALAPAPRLDRPFLAAALLALAVLVALVLADGQPASAGLLLSGFALGADVIQKPHADGHGDRHADAGG